MKKSDEPCPKWYVVVLKVVSYIITALLGGVGGMQL